jgi:hypothetical protein
MPCRTTPIHLDNFLLNGSGSASAVKLIEEHILKTELIESYFPRLPWIECIQLVQFSLFIMPDLNNILPLLSELNANKIDIPWELLEQRKSYPAPRVQKIQLQ